MGLFRKGVVPVLCARDRPRFQRPTLTEGTHRRSKEHPMNDLDMTGGLNIDPVLPHFAVNLPALTDGVSGFVPRRLPQ